MIGHTHSYNYLDMNQNQRQQYLEAIGVQNWQLKSTPDYSEQNTSVDEVDVLSYEVNEPVQSCETVNKFQTKEPRVEQSLEEQAYGSTPSENQNLTNELIVRPSGPNASIEQPNTLFESPTAIDTHESSTMLQPIINESHERENLQSEEVVSVSPIVKTVKIVTELEQSITHCKQCANRQTRLNALSGQGNSKASIFIVSEAPTAEEDRSGQYLNQQSALLFDAMFQSIDSTDDYFYTGIIKCYSFSDYLFTESEVAQCAPFLYTQIEQIQPSVLVIFGAIQAQAILQSKNSFNELRGKIHHVTINDKEYPVIVTYHPAYLLRNPLYKREALSDLIMIKKLCNE